MHLVCVEQTFVETHTHTPKKTHHRIEYQASVRCALFAKCENRDIIRERKGEGMEQECVCAKKFQVTTLTLNF